MAGSFLLCAPACGWRFTVDGVFFGQQYGQLYSKIEHVRMPEGMINMWVGFLVGVLWQGFVTNITHIYTPACV